MTKSKALVIGIIGLTLFGIAALLSLSGSCTLSFVCERSHDDSLALILFPIIPFFIFSLITYKMREEIFQAWWRFARVWVPLSMLAILLAPSTANNWMFPIEKGSVAFFSSAAFFIISIVLILHKYSQMRKK